MIDEVRVYNVALDGGADPDGHEHADRLRRHAAAHGAEQSDGPAVSPSQINLSWTASTDNVGVTGYLVELPGPGLHDFAQIATTTGTTTYNNTGLTAGTSYSYRVRATDAAGNLSPYSNVASATTPPPDTQPPTAPTNLTATAVSGSQINLSWTASTDNVGVTWLPGGAVPGRRAAPASCQVGTTDGTPRPTTTPA